MEIINGYACRNCVEAEIAKRNIDPAKGIAGARLEEMERRHEKKVQASAPAAALVPPLDPNRGRRLDLVA